MGTRSFAAGPTIEASQTSLSLESGGINSSVVWADSSATKPMQKDRAACGCPVLLLGGGAKLSRLG
jgi:hypothetical protein